MKLKSIGRMALATASSLAIGLGTTSCSRDYIAAYVYTTSAQNASVSAFAVDYQSGVLTQIAGSPFTAGIGRNPVAVVALQNSKTLYVISHDDSTVTEFAIGTDGKLYGQNTYNIPNNGSYPTSAAVDSTGSYLYVAFTYQNGYGPGTPGPGGIAIFPINSDGTLNKGSATTVAAGIGPAAIAVSAPICSTSPLVASNPTCTSGSGSGHTNTFVYVVDQQTATTGIILGYYQNGSSGALTQLSAAGYTAGISPSGIAIDPTTEYVYVSDKSANLIYGYRISNSINGTPATGNLTALPTSPYTTGLYPLGITIDPRGKYLMTANYNANSVSSFSINLSDGSLGGTATTGTVQTDTGPTCVTIEPALGIYVYTSNSIGDDITGLQMNANTGALSSVPNTPFPAGALPSCIVAVANGSHTQSLVNP